MARTHHIEALTRSPCPECHGSGSTAPGCVKPDDPEEIVCPYPGCGGSGYVEQWRRIAVGAVHLRDRAVAQAS